MAYAPNLRITEKEIENIFFNNRYASDNKHLFNQYNRYKMPEGH